MLHAKVGDAARRARWWRIDGRNETVKCQSKV